MQKKQEAAQRKRYEEELSGSSSIALDLNCTTASQKSKGGAGCVREQRILDQRNFSGCIRRIDQQQFAERHEEMAYFSRTKIY